MAWLWRGLSMCCACGRRTMMLPKMSMLTKVKPEKRGNLACDDAVLGEGGEPHPLDVESLRYERTMSLEVLNDGAATWRWA